MPKDVNIHIKTQGQTEAVSAVESVSYSVDQMGNTVAESTGKGKKGLDDFSAGSEQARRKSQTLTRTLGTLSARFVSITAVIALATKAVRENMQAIEEHAELAERQQLKLASLQYLGDLFKEKPELRKEVAAYAEFGRRPFEDVAQAWYNLRSKAAALPTEQQQQILREALELGRTAGEVPLDVIVDMFTLYAKKTGEVNANVVQNILQQTITEAGGTAADVAGYMPRTLPLGLAAGLTGPETAGLWAYASTQAAEASIATTGLNTILYALSGRGTPQSAALLRQLGIRPGMGFMPQLQRLAAAQRGGRLGLPEAELIAGREGASMLLSILSDLPGLQRTMANVVGVARPDLDITAAKIEGLMGADEMARLADQNRQLDIQIENIKASDTESLRKQNLYRRYEKALREEGYSDFEIWYNKLALRTLGGVGVEAETLEDWSNIGPPPRPNIQIGDTYNTVEQPVGAPRSEDLR
jgi:hypothetical protein